MSCCNKIRYCDSHQNACDDDLMNESLRHARITFGKKMSEMFA